ncbi:G-protein coupled receptor GRL101-like [Pocillopora damicornis]|nr:G-protein coupled receptor GRL101-like [Pocillopora damicornis]
MVILERTLDFNKLEKLPFDLFKDHKFNDLWLGNNYIKTLPERLFAGQTKLRRLHLGGNQLKKLPRDIFHGLTNLEELDLSYNQLHNLSRGILSTNTKLKKLDLSNNAIKRLPSKVFGNLTELKRLVLSSNGLQRLPRFNNLSKIEILDFHLNKISAVTKEQFKDVASNIRFLYLHYNEMRELPKGFFSNMKELITTTVDTSLMCCHLTKVDADCDFAYVDRFASCETMFRNRAPRKCVWVISVTSLVGAVFVITWRMVYREENIAQSIMLIHLAVSDGLMGVYLIIIGWKDAMWAGKYYLHDFNWRTSLSCQISGAIAVLSSEVSMMLLSLISADRLKNIVFPFSVNGLTNKATHTLCFAIWIIGFIIAFLPTFSIQYFKGRHFYGRSVVCLPLQLSNDKAPAWEYSVAVFVGLNLAFLAFVIVAYLTIVINRCQVQSMSAKTQRETALAKRVFFIILTDCICWMPIIVIALRSIVEKSFRTRGDLAVWIAVFFLPFNSAINPILYTLSTTQVRDVLKAKWQQLCNYFITKCGRTQAGKESAKEAEEEPEKEQEEVHKHEHPGEEHTELQFQQQLITKYAETAKPEKPETEPNNFSETIEALPTETKTEGHKKSQKNIAANSEYEEPHTDFVGDEDKSTGKEQNKTDVDNDHSAAKGTTADPQINSDEVVEETVWETAV